MKNIIAITAADNGGFIFTDLQAETTSAVSTLGELRTGIDGILKQYDPENGATAPAPDAAAAPDTQAEPENKASEVVNIDAAPGTTAAQS